MTDERIAAIRERCEREKVIEATGRKANGVYLDTVPFLLTEIDRLQSEQAARLDPKPLTLDELMDMNGLPVWCIDGDGHSCYCLVNADNKDCIDSESGVWCFEFFRMTDVGTNRLHKMGWIAYDHPPKEEQP